MTLPPMATAVATVRERTTRPNRPALWPEQRAEQPAQQPPEHPPEHPAEHSAQQPAQQPVAQPAEQLALQPAERLAPHHLRRSLRPGGPELPVGPRTWAASQQRLPGGRRH